jgi:hypothetical protein
MNCLGTIGGRKVRITPHALARMVEMKVPAWIVELTITSPDEVFPSKSYPGDTCYTRGDHCLATATDEDDVLVIKTVLYSTMRAWLRANERGDLPPDRVVRTDTGIPH